MKYIILITALGGDLLILLAFAYLFYLYPKATLLFSILAYFLWKNMGGFSNWKLSTMKTFLKNWDKI